MKCHICGDSATGQCSECRRFMCNRHTEVRTHYSISNDASLADRLMDLTVGGVGESWDEYVCSSCD